ncbi:orotidine-5'-phosphate decarboxylase [Helicobacter sp. MIT 14-3879]|uniref:orotidine-5'-phosphate decarboxylase n=1 Tax=Helicobacter sp. MIT 14-3879 TaxID=2040649 RepID=UPI000E1E2C0A|nr:orotidine-5'-phosphate decarboxylase [Helicobacter sp. MIT 14-3879]RDU62205.1 orotidine-5'-phosphate decarboxylase [Helicobacter sp. MIT 14-3879]
MRLCVALDMPSKEQNLTLVTEISRACKNINLCADKVWLKVGLRSYIRDGASFIRMLQDRGYKIFLDLKLYDIPNTMLDSISECEKLHINMLTIHASCGFEAMSAISQHLNQNQSNMLVIAVSALTSFNEAGFYEVYGMSVKEGVKRLAEITYRAGISGLVCSINEVEIIKGISTSLLAITPGIRLSVSEESLKDDQKRATTLQEAKKARSDFIVIGRPIYTADNRIEVIENILREIES